MRFEQARLDKMRKLLPADQIPEFYLWQEKQEKIALALLQQCKDDGLTIQQTKCALNRALEIIDEMVNDFPIGSLHNPQTSQTNNQMPEGKNQT